MLSANKILRRPIYTEKSTAFSEVANCYTFEVALQANKFQIKEVIESSFAVKVLEVRTLIVPGKVKRAGKTHTKRPSWKKAIVQLSVGQELNFLQKE